MYKVDLHTHSEASPDGSISAEQYQKTIDSKLLDVIAITDHNRIDFAQKMHALLPDSIIVGEEIMTTAGEIIGLYLSEVIIPGQTPHETIRAIKKQGGIVYIPHPFETVRKGLHPAVLDELVEYVDIIEVCNGRALLQNKSAQSAVWARLNAKISAASSDAHGMKGLGTTYTTVQSMPNSKTLKELMDSGIPMTTRPKIRALLYPKINRLRKKRQRKGIQQ